MTLLAKLMVSAPVLLGMSHSCSGSACAPSWNATALPVVDLGYELHQAISLNETGQYYNFSNIRFAAPPVGDLRFRAPVPAWNMLDTNSANATGERTVTNGSVGRVCPQSSGNWSIVSQEFLKAVIAGNASSFNYDAAVATVPESDAKVSYDARTTEDCLFLDVLAPRGVWTGEKTGLPVLVWLYGGGYTSGEKTGGGEFNPAGLFRAAAGSNNGSFVFVAINYRLGALGFLSGPQVFASGTPNAAFFDQRTAFQWVQRYIHLFGGDPARVTVMGGSAGAGSIMHHVTSYAGAEEDTGAPFFSQAIMMSPAFQPAPTQLGPAKAAAGFLKALGVETLDEARQMNSSAVIAANAAFIYSQAPYGSNLFGPVVDGSFAPALPGELLANGTINRNTVKKIMVMHNTNEGLVFTRPSIVTQQDYSNLLEADFPSASDQTLAFVNATLYPPVFDGSEAYENEFERASSTTQDVAIVCNTRYLASAMSEDAYALRFAVPPGYHGQETPYVFANGATAGLNTAVAAALQQYIVSFVLASAPASVNGTTNPVYGTDATLVNLGNTTIAPMHDDTANQRCAWWQQGLYA